ncbi:MAG: hypothetical protein HY525_16775 [Betaproteobacteria bacterium]|nr:hypothetical protein [Betaproteobacteria bacterium]
MVQLVDDFNRAVAQGAELGISGYNGMQMVKLAIAMQESSRQGKAFRIN